MAKKFLVSPGRCYVVTGPVGTTITAEDGTVVNSIVTGSTQCSFIPSVNEVTVDPDTAKLEQVSRGIAVRSSNNGGGSGGGGGGSTVNDWITVNEAGEAVLNFPEETNPLIENISLSYSLFSKITGTTGGKLNAANFLWYIPATEANVIVPSAHSSGNFLRSSSVQIADLLFKKSQTISSSLHGCTNLTKAKIVAEKALSCANLIGSCPLLTTFEFNLASMATIDFTSTSSNGGLGNVPTLENVTVLDGGLASCTSFLITNSTNLTDVSIQNIIDALPDYSGTETSALVSFPPDRLTTEQQAQLTSKGWTWS